jgi:hypothetical protein
MNSSKKIKSDKAKSRRKLDGEFSAAIARAAEAFNARIEAKLADARDQAKAAAHEYSTHRRTRELLVKVLGMLGSDRLGERAAAALIAERLRAELGKTWNQLIAREDNDDEDFDDDLDNDEDDDDEDTEDLDDDEEDAS